MLGSRKRINIGMVLASAIWVSAGASVVAQEIHKMPADDRATVEEFLGRGVVGKAVPATPIDDPIKYFQFSKDATYDVKITSGEHKGELVDHSVRKVGEDSDGMTWEVRAGKTETLVFKQNKHGDIVFLNHAETGEGDAHYSPYPPLLKKGMKPGSTHEADFAVKVLSIDDPNKIKHTGQLHLKLSYLGMFELNIPSGRQNAVLIKSAYHGKIGPATVDDTQYRFFVENVGIVAMVERKDISAFWVYNEHKKVGKILVRRK